MPFFTCDAIIGWSYKSSSKSFSWWFFTKARYHNWSITSCLCIFHRIESPCQACTILLWLPRLLSSPCVSAIGFTRRVRFAKVGILAWQFFDNFESSPVLRLNTLCASWLCVFRTSQRGQGMRGRLRLQRCIGIVPAISNSFFIDFLQTVQKDATNSSFRMPCPTM